MKQVLILIFISFATSCLVRAQKCPTLINFSGSATSPEFEFKAPIRANANAFSLFLTAVTYEKSIAIIFAAEQKNLCPAKGDTIRLAFSDGTVVTVRNDFDTNCDGKFAVFTGGEYGRENLINLLINQDLRTIKIHTETTEMTQIVMTDCAQKFKPSLQCLSASLTSNDTVQELKKADDEKTFMVVEKQAGFPGGLKALAKFVTKNIKKPANVKGQVVVSFIIQRDGSITDPQVVKGLSEKANAAALALIKSMPSWIPGTANGEPVNSKFVLPIPF